MLNCCDSHLCIPSDCVMICPLLEMTVCARGRGDRRMGKFAELGKEYDVIVTQVTANQGLEFE